MAIDQAIPLGKTLRTAREQQGWSLADVAQQIKLSAHHLAALENEDFASLPDITFVRGFVRSYGKLLKLDVAALLSALPSPSYGLNVVAAAAPLPMNARRKQNFIWLGGTIFVVLLAITFAVWSVNTPKNIPASLPIPVLSAAISSVSAPVASNVIASNVASAAVIVPVAAPLRLVFDEDAWVEVKDQSGKTLSSQLNRGGSELSLNGQAPFDLVIGNSTAVHLFYQGEEVDLAEYVSYAGSSIARLELE